MRIILSMAVAGLIGGSAPTALAGESEPAGSPLRMPGGLIDPAFPGADVYLGDPAATTVPPGKACNVAGRYVELVNARDYAGVAALYADDATFLEPMRPNLHGRDQIDAFYTQRIGAMTPEIAAVAYLGNERECMVELALKTQIDGKARWVLVSIDHFILDDDGKVASMTAFARPPGEE